MRAIAGMARSYNGYPELRVMVGASLLANRIPRRLQRWAVREQARSYEQPAAISRLRAFRPCRRAPPVRG